MLQQSSQRFRAGVAGLAAMLALWVSPGHAHEWEEMQPMPDVILERLVEVLEAAAAANRFKTTPPPGCIPHDCLDNILQAVSEPDFAWLRVSPDAEIPSGVFGRLPANVSYEWLFDLVMLLDLDDPTPTQAQLIARTETALTHWTQL